MNSAQAWVMDSRESLRRLRNALLLDAILLTPTGKKLFNERAESYLGGHSLEECIQIMDRQFQESRVHAIIDLLGENSSTIEEADKYFKEYSKIPPALNNSFPTQNVVSVSIKPSSICMVNPEGRGLSNNLSLYNRLGEYATLARNYGIEVTQDMESSFFTDVSLDTAQQLWHDGLDNLGIVLQTRLNRTEGDIQNYIVKQDYPFDKSKIKIRLVVGIYVESRKIASGKAVAKLRFPERAAEILDAGAYLQIATHDTRLIERVINEVICPREQRGQIDKSRYELQILRGIRVVDSVVKQFVDGGIKVSEYNPYEAFPRTAKPYMRRRLIANPELFDVVVREFFYDNLSRAAHTKIF